MHSLLARRLTIYFSAVQVGHKKSNAKSPSPFQVLPSPSLIFIYSIFCYDSLTIFLLICLFPCLLIETLSMKGLTLNCMDRKSEAYELVRQGLKVYMFSLILNGLSILWSLFVSWPGLNVLFCCRMTLKVMFVGMFLVFFIGQTENIGRQLSATGMHWK